MLTSELKYIFKNDRSQIRILLGILLIPAFYAVIFLSSLWNPYQETKNLPVAVVNEDKAITSNGTQFDFGKQLTKSLKKNKSLHFEFLTKSKAHSDLNSGKVYMIIQIPKDFSKQASKLSEPNAKQIKLDYYTSAGHSFVAMKMSTTAIEKIQTQLNNKISKLYLNSLVAKTNASGTMLKQALSNAKSSLQLKSIAQSIQPLATNNRIVDPIKLIHHDSTHVKNNGTGMAPYLMSVALFVGCITLNIIYDTYTPRNDPKNGLSWWSSKMLFLFGFIIVAASIMYGLLVYFCGLEPLQILKTYGFVLLTGITFLSIVTFFNLLFGMTGAWLMLLFMIIQLGGSAGTYPIELSNNFFKTIHPYLPMTISVNAFRSTISIGNSISSEIIIFLTLFVIFNLSTVLFFHIKNHKKYLHSL
ncbi:YhgE/Pip domain-containing protein [Companilactobacillus insicii]|uniref:YhgE/Pip domain-containing protein n=1 Tax=Companilactobacillus insicii TaxID=1732567 RepID=UPI000F7A7F4F|nr:YhgE/Pip family protein [Companilactobacillus insicii]